MKGSLKGQESQIMKEFGIQAKAMVFISETGHFSNRRVKEQTVSLSPLSLIAHPVPSPTVSHYLQAVSFLPRSSGAGPLVRRLGHVYPQTLRWQDSHFLLLSPSLWPSEPTRHSRTYLWVYSNTKQRQGGNDRKHTSWNLRESKSQELTFFFFF